MLYNGIALAQVNFALKYICKEKSVCFVAKLPQREFQTRLRVNEPNRDLVVNGGSLWLSLISSKMYLYRLLLSILSWIMELNFISLKLNWKGPYNSLKYMFHSETNFMLSLNCNYWQLSLAVKGKENALRFFSVM